MTISSDTTRVQYSGNGATTSFTISFVFWDADDLTVTHTASDGTETTWSRGTQYTVTGGSGSTGTLTVSTSPTDYTPASGETLTIESALPYTQPTSLPTGGALPSASVEGQFDKIVRQVQQVRSDSSRTLRQPISDTTAIGRLPTKTERASKYLGFDADGDPMAVSGAGDATPVSAFMATVLDDATAAAARATLVAAKAEAGNGLALSGDTLSLADYRGALVSKSGAQSIATATATVLTWDTENRDTDAIHDGASNTERLTVPSGVTLVRLRANVQFAANATGTRTVGILKNGGDAAGLPDATIPAAAGGAVTSLNITSAVISVTAGDYFTVSVTQNSGGNLYVDAVEGTWFEMEIVR